MQKVVTCCGELILTDFNLVISTPTAKLSNFFPVKFSGYMVYYTQQPPNNGLKYESTGCARASHNTYLRFAVSHVLQNQLKQLHCIFLLLFVSSEHHWLFDWVLGGWEGEWEEGASWEGGR